MSEKTMTFTMRLLRDAVTVNEVLKDGSTLRELTWIDQEGVRAFAGTVFSNPPTWMDFLSSQTSDFPDLNNEGSAAVVFFPVGGKVIAVCFGQAQIAMDLDLFERHFGLKVALNSISRDHIKSLDSATPDSTTVQKRIQVSRDSDIGQFDLDYDRDLLTMIAGTAKRPGFAKFLAGKDCLRITCKLKIEDLSQKCKEVLAVYLSDDYKTDYGWIDHIQPVKERAKIDQLDNTIWSEIESLRAGNNSELHLSPPEIHDYMCGDLLHYNGFGSHGNDFTDLIIEEYIAELNNAKFAGDFSAIKTGHTIAMKKDGSDSFSARWKIYDSFVFETTFAGETYVIFGGNWYRVDQTFADEVEQFYKKVNRIPVVNKTLCKNEKQVIADLESSRTDLVMLDCSKINPSGTKHANLEPCDFYSDKKQFIHFKDGHSSSSISHLWLQGLVSGEAFLKDSQFRTKVRNKIKEIKPGFEKHFHSGRSRPTASDYTVIFGIMRKAGKAGSVSLPFFSKVSLRPIIERLETYGYKTGIELIEKV